MVVLGMPWRFRSDADRHLDVADWIFWAKKGMQWSEDTGLGPDREIKPRQVPHVQKCLSPDR